MYKPAIVTGIVTAMLAVIFGAFGAHALKAMVSPDQIAIFEKGVTYQFYHSFALIAAGILYLNFPGKAIRVATVLFFIGILLFSGSLYAMVGLSTASLSIGPAGVITPIGGLCFIVGWTSLLVGVLNEK